MALFNPAQMIAQARPQMMGGQRMQTPEVRKSKETKEVGHGKIGEEFGKGFGSMFDPDEMMQRALQTQKLIASMPKELRQNTLANPAVQARLKNYYRFVPELFADAALTTGNEKLKGMLDFVDEEYSARQKQETEKEMDKAKLDTQKEQPAAIRSQTAENKAGTQLKEQQFNWQERIEDIEYDLKRSEPALAMAKLQALKEETSLRKEQTLTQAAERRMLPQREDLMKAQARHLDKETSLMAAKLRLATDKSTIKMSDEEKQVLGVRMKTYEKQEQAYAKTKQFQMPEFSVQQINDTNAMVQAMQRVPVGQGEQTVYLPRVLTNSAGMMWVNKSLDDAFSTVAQGSKKLPPEKLDAVFQSMDQLYKNTYSYLTNPAVQELLPQEILQSTHDPQMRAKCLFVQLVNEKQNGMKLQNGQRVPITKDRETQLMQLIEQSGGVPSVVTMNTRPSFWENFTNMFSPSDAGVE